MRYYRGPLLLIIIAGLVFTVAGYSGWALLAYPGELLGEDSANDEERRVRVYFQSLVLDGLPVRFSPSERIQDVVVGREVRNSFLFQNLSDETVYFTPIHSVTPADAARNYSMTVCFCFYDQKMPPNSTAEFTLVYQLDPAMSRRSNPVHINYNLRRTTAEDYRGNDAGEGHGKDAEIQIISEQRQHPLFQVAQREGGVDDVRY